MKIKEKGLSGKSAQIRRQNMENPRTGFNAFRDAAKLANGKGDASKEKGKAKQEEKPKPEVWLEFMGAKIRVHEDEDGVGYVKEEEVPIARGSSLKFEGCGGEVQFKEVKVRCVLHLFPVKSVVASSY